MPRPTRPASEVHPVPIQSDAATAVAEPPAPESQPKEPAKQKVRFQINQIQNITFPDGSTYPARLGTYDIEDEKLIKDLKEFIARPGSKPGIFILNQ